MSTRHTTTADRAEGESPFAPNADHLRLAALHEKSDVQAESRFDRLRETEHFLSEAAVLPAEDEYLPVSAWTTHVPFMHCLVRYMRPRRFVELGSHYGTSFFAACRTVLELPGHTECIAIDSWRGDEHSSHYPEEVFEQFKRRLDSSYAGFASFVRARFGEAVGSFSDGSIDLLHIDGYHTYDAVKNDFESWLPKMSDAGIVIMHDTCVRSGNFGVFRFLDELSNRYACVNLAHDSGLAIVSVGKAQTRCQKLVEAWAADEGLANVVVEFFKCAGFFSSRYGELQKAVAERNQRQQLTEDEVASLRTEIQQAAAALAVAHTQLTEACQQIADLNQTVESVERWQKRSWFNRAFHKWRRPEASRGKIGLLKKLERSIRKRCGLN
ncbi:MAG: class I SAM-dependent methyltransferase [Planctomycetota bacterium]